jgi:hypothetical protein
VGATLAPGVVYSFSFQIVNPAAAQVIVRPLPRQRRPGRERADASARSRRTCLDLHCIYSAAYRGCGGDDSDRRIWWEAACTSAHKDAPAEEMPQRRRTTDGSMLDEIEVGGGVLQAGGSVSIQCGAAVPLSPVTPDAVNGPVRVDGAGFIVKSINQSTAYPGAPVCAGGQDERWPAAAMACVGTINGRAKRCGSSRAAAFDTSQECYGMCVAVVYWPVMAVVRQGNAYTWP